MMDNSAIIEEKKHSDKAQKDEEYARSLREYGESMYKLRRGDFSEVKKRNSPNTFSSPKHPCP